LSSERSEQVSVPSSDQLQLKNTTLASCQIQPKTLKSAETAIIFNPYFKTHLDSKLATDNKPPIISKPNIKANEILLNLDNI
jgi:hypothetical protein